jgi:urease accessory protein
MIRATKVRPAGSWRESAADRLTLDFDARHRRRMAMTGENGLAFLLDLPQATHLHDGDGLVLEDGRIVAVRAAPEALLEVTARDLAKIAWHIGNRHASAQIENGRILIRRDPVLARMLEGLGARIREVDEPFDPEGGAYGGQSHEH